MVIAAHPDDADFGPAATAAGWIDEGSVGWLVCCTSGDQGGEDPNIDPLELAALREREQRAAAEVVGYAGVSFLHMPDGALANDLVLREHLVREIRTFKPDAVLATDPENLFHARRRRQPHGPSRRGLCRRRRRLPGGAQPDGLPVARADGLAAHRSAACTCSGPTSRPRTSTSRRRSSARSPRCVPREPDRGPLARGRGLDPRVVRRARVRRSESRTRRDSRDRDR